MKYLVGRYYRQTLDYTIYDHTTRKVSVYNLDKLKELLKREKVENIKLSGNTIVGTQGDVSRYYDVRSRICLTVIGVEQGIYKAVFNTGKLVSMKEEELIRASRQYPLTNATVDVRFRDTRNEKAFIKPKSGNFPVLHDTVERLDYDITDFEKWRKEYAKIDLGVYGDSGAYDGGALTTPFGQEIKQSNSKVHEFIKSYKLVRSRLINDREYKYRKLYSMYKVENGQVVSTGDVVGVHVIWTSGKELFILWQDKKLIKALVNINEEKVDNLEAIRNLLLYNNSEPEAKDSIIASQQICNNHNVDKFNNLLSGIKDGQVDYILFNKRFEVCSLMGDMKIKYKCSISSRDNRVM